MKKQFNKITVLLIVIITILSCEQDLVVNNATNSSVDAKSQYVDGMEANEVIGKINKLLGNNFTNNSSSDSKIMNSGIGKIQTNSAVKLIDKNGNITYTFRLDHPKTSASKFYNLVFSGKAGREIIRLMEYNLSEKFQKHYLLTKKYTKFSGKLRSKTLVNRTDCPEPIYIVNIANIGDNSAAGGGSPDGTSNSGGNYTGGSYNNSTGNQTGADNGSSGSNGTDGTNGSTNNGGTGTNTGGSGGNTNETDAALIEAIIECIQFGGTWFEGQCIANPRFFRLAVQREISPTTENNPCPQNPFQFLTIVPNTPFESTFMNNLSPEERKWLYESQNTDSSTYYEILDFMNGDGITYSNDNEVFVKQFINNAIANSNLKFSFDDSIKSPANIDRSGIDDNSTEGKKFNEIYDKLKNVPEFKAIFIDIFGNSKRPNVKFEIAEHVYKNDDPTLNIEVNALTRPTPNPSTYIIKINKQCLVPNGTKLQTNLENAKTIAHEAIHAFLNNLIENSNSAIVIPNIDQKNLTELLNALKTANPDQHNLMFNNLAPILEKILKSLKNELATLAQRAVVENMDIYQIQNPQSNPTSWNWDNYFKFLSYEGLQESLGFQTTYPDNSDIKFVYNQYIANGHANL